MSATRERPDDGPEYTITELLNMDAATARSELSHAQFERWEAANDHKERYDEAKQRWDDTRTEATRDLVTADPTDFAADVSVWGNDLAVYFASDDPRLRETVERLTDVFDIDPEAARDGDVEELSSEDVAEEDIDAAKGVLADLVCLAAVSWNGEAWDGLAPAERDAIREAIMADPPDGWGLAGLMDAWVEIQFAVENARDERMERVQKFRSAGRRGDR
jgi:hypothetical protein